MPRGHPPGRRPTPCRHCDMVDDYRLQRAAEVAVHDEHHWRDETAWSRLINFKRWLIVFEWERDS